MSARNKQLREGMRKAMLPYAAELAAAAASLESIRARLEVNFTVCSCCGTRRYDNFAEKLAADRLASIQGKLETLTDPEGDD